MIEFEEPLWVGAKIRGSCGIRKGGQVSRRNDRQIGQSKMRDGTAAVRQTHNRRFLSAIIICGSEVCDVKVQPPLCRVPLPVRPFSFPQVSKTHRFANLCWCLAALTSHYLLGCRTDLMLQNLQFHLGSDSAQSFDISIQGPPG